jgi:cation-transporting ATPase 13A3/4/5
MEEQLFTSSEFTMTERLLPGVSGQPSQYVTFIKPSEAFLQSCDHDSDFEYKIIRRVDFSSERKRMSVVLGNNKDGSLRVITKGAPEVLKQLCDPTSLPFNFDEVLEEYTEQGLRVIAIARRRIDSLEEAISASPLALESKLEFLGFFLFENPLKPNTSETILALKACKINCKMITGDNILTATSVGIATGLIQKSAALFAAHAEDGSLWWEQLENEDERREKHTSIFSENQSGIYLSRKSSESNIETDSHDEEEQNSQKKLIQAYCDRNSCCIVMTGQAFDQLFVEGWEKDKFLNSVLEASVIFARTSPEQKAQIVEKIQKWYKNRSSDNWFVAFCGDGANDCSALKKADVGLSLSEAEASIAAPFNTTSPDISAMLPLLREGKASLETAFMNFKYILYYSFVQFFALMAAYNHAQEFANGHYYFMDLIVFLPLSIFICSNGTNPQLNHHFPKSSLMKREVLFEIFGHITIAGLFFLLIDWVFSSYPETLHPDEIVHNKEIDAEVQFNVGVFGFFIMSSVLYAVGALVFNRGYPFKVSPWKNVPLVAYASVSLVVTVIILFAGLTFSDGRLLFSIDRIFRELRFDGGIIALFAICTLLASLACFFFEKSALPAFRQFIKQQNHNSKKKKGKS